MPYTVKAGAATLRDAALDKAAHDKAAVAQRCILCRRYVEQCACEEDDDPSGYGVITGHSYPRHRPGWDD